MTRPPAKPITLRSRVPNDAKGLTLIEFLLRRFRYHDRASWLQQIDAGRIQLDGVVAHSEQVLGIGMELSYEKLHREPEVDLGFRVLHRDDALLAVDKPAHLPMHADGPFLRNTLIHQLREQDGDNLQLVHRLDRETSGVCIVATSKQAQALIQAQFQQGLRKTYCAVVHGIMRDAAACEEPIGHHASSDVKLRRSAAPDALRPKLASTRFEPLRHGNDKTLVRCLPETGRTHQIRVHLEHLGHAVVGDKLYGQPDAHYIDFVHRMKAGESVFENPAGEARQAPNRQLLHAHQIAFQHPTGAQQVCYEAPIPAEFERWLLS